MHQSCRKQIEEMLQLAKRKPEFASVALLFLVAYIFLARLPSEALPAEVGRVPGREQQAILELEDNKMVLTLQRRKNRPQGTQRISFESGVAGVSHIFRR